MNYMELKVCFITETNYHIYQLSAKLYQSGRKKNIGLEVQKVKSFDTKKFEIHVN